ncbi:subtilisin-like protease SBT5.3 [Beta vulgaris subsp. vulgaris]|uniref:subtilisin-like protease SBT5.3 n=1 Tax=Beta vulgaris subsp. vulgaris TaxID=3555 RepID=UPI0025489036|nr:subtilisin-like protease SBT5.3 [Beta vulgaris subsp. vulgaris]
MCNPYMLQLLKNGGSIYLLLITLVVNNRSSAKAEDAILYSYNKVFNGFTALLHQEEARELQKHPDVISVFKSQLNKIHTTRSWEFLGLEDNGYIPNYSIWRKNFGEDSIIATLDTGVWPESRSFSDENLGLIPKKFKGTCENENDPTFRCNRKLIGARYFFKGYAEALRQEYNMTFNHSKSPRDSDGHGSHTLSIAGGNIVSDVNVKGFGKGTAAGGSPRARVAAYKTCWPSPSNQESYCSDSDILAGLEAAIADGVDIISMSIGKDPRDYLSDSIAIGSFHAVKNGIPVVAAAGNNGPKSGSVANVAPWIFTVGASTTDRQFLSYVTLGNNKNFKGASITHKGLDANKFYGLVTSVIAQSPKANATEAKFCFNGTMDPEKVKGKILVCLRGLGARKHKGYEAARVGAVGLIIANTKEHGMQIMAENYPLPASHLAFSDAQALFAYINSTNSPVATITAARTEFGVKPAPFVAGFSSRGPNIVTPGILKPDVIAPGVNIIAAISEAKAKSTQENTPYGLMDGTSMSCPHITGIIGLLKTMYPHWSPSAIKSAIMTTASTRDNRRKPLVDFTNMTATPFHYGAGHVRPNRAMYPGLVYDMNHHDYLNFLCTIGYNKKMIKKLSDNSYCCPDSVAVADLNYPTIFVPSFSGNATIVRRLKNVGHPSTYLASIRAPSGISITVEPKTLTFTEKGQELHYKLIFTAEQSHLLKDHSFGYLLWSDRKYRVRSSIVVKAYTTE